MPETEKLRAIERKLLERREHFAAMNDDDLQACSNPDMFLTSEKLLSHYDQIIAIVQQAIAIGEHLSPENRQKLTDIMKPCPNERKSKAGK